MKMKLLLIVLGLVGLSTSFKIESFERYESFFNKTYTSRMEKAHRMKIFQENLKIIKEHNANPISTYKMGVNRFTDLTDQEKRQFLRRKSGLDIPAPTTERSAPINVDDLPKNIDWRDKGVITSVKDQGDCGSCWAFSAVGQIESYYALGGFGLEDLSPQQLVSCVDNSYHCGGYGGCSGAIENLAYVYTLLYGLTTEDKMPYTSGKTGNDGKCKYNPNDSKVYLKGFNNLPHNDMEAIMDHLANKGPLAVGIDASKLHSYDSGIFDGCDYNENIEINHGVQVVGYGTDEKLGDFWLIRNSWGDSWGENGYVRFKRESKKVCGTNATPENGDKCENDGLKAYTVCGMCGLLSNANYPIDVIPKPIL